MTRSVEVSALFVASGGVYFGLEGVDAWDITRDAREYAGPNPVVAHPPCERWGRYWGGGPNARVKRTLGDDDGCFASALWDVRAYTQHHVTDEGCCEMNTAPPSINLALMAWKLAQIRMHPFVMANLAAPTPRDQVDDLTPCSTEYYHLLRRIEDGETL